MPCASARARSPATASSTPSARATRLAASGAPGALNASTCGSTTACVRACGRPNVPPSTWQSLWCNPDPATANADEPSHAPHSSSAGSTAIGPPRTPAPVAPPGLDAAPIATPARSPAASRPTASAATAVLTGLRPGAHIASTACASALNPLAAARSGGNVAVSVGS